MQIARTVTIVSLSFFASQPSYALSLNEALEKVSNAPAVLAGKALVDEQHAQVDMATGMFYPQVTLSHGYGLSNDPVRVFSAKLQQRRFTASDFDIATLNNPDSVHHWHTRFQLAQPILNSLVDIRNRSAASKAAEASENEQEHRIATLRLQVANLYWMAVSLRDQGAATQEGISKLSHLEKRYGLMEAPTPATTTSFYVTQSVRLALEAQRNGLVSGESNVKRQLITLLDREGDASLELSDDLPKDAPPLPDSKHETRADVKAATLQSVAAKRKADATTATWGPRIDFITGYNLYTGDYSSIDRAYDVGLMLTWPIFSGPRSGQIRAANARAKAAQEMKRIKRLQADTDLHNAMEDYSARRKEMKLIFEATEKATRSIHLAKRRYQEGSLPLFDYSQSIQNWVEIQRESIRAQERFAHAKIRLDFERGRL